VLAQRARAVGVARGGVALAVDDEHRRLGAKPEIRENPKLGETQTRRLSENAAGVYSRTPRKSPPNITYCMCAVARAHEFQRDGAVGLRERGDVHQRREALRVAAVDGERAEAGAAWRASPRASRAGGTRRERRASAARAGAEERGGARQRQRGEPLHDGRERLGECERHAQVVSSERGCLQSERVGSAGYVGVDVELMESEQRAAGSSASIAACIAPSAALESARRRAVSGVPGTTCCATSCGAASANSSSCGDAIDGRLGGGAGSYAIGTMLGRGGRAAGAGNAAAGMLMATKSWRTSFSQRGCPTAGL
jgi:hypothetical protein